MEKQRSWSNMLLNNKNINSLFLRRTKFKYYAKMLMHLGKQRKSLPPEKKVKMLETDAAAHKKQRKSLPPDDKVQNLNKDADAHKKT
jgi:hypothetical protein